MLLALVSKHAKVRMDEGRRGRIAQDVCQCREHVLQGWVGEVVVKSRNVVALR